MIAPIHAFLRGDAPDARDRLLADILAQDDAWLEGVHDYIQWLFPLRQRSRAVPSAPVLDAAQADAIRADPKAQDGVRQAAARMARFYQSTTHWLSAYDHNHLRITRILTALHDLLGPFDATAFHAALVARLEAAGAPVNRESLAHWRGAVAGGRKG